MKKFCDTNTHTLYIYLRYVLKQYGGDVQLSENAILIQRTNTELDSFVIDSQKDIGLDIINGDYASTKQTDFRGMLACLYLVYGDRYPELKKVIQDTQQRELIGWFAQKQSGHINKEIEYYKDLDKKLKTGTYYPPKEVNMSEYQPSWMDNRIRAELGIENPSIMGMYDTECTDVW